MKKLGIYLILLLLVLPGILAINVDVKKLSSGETIIRGSDSPVMFKLAITNFGEDDSFKIYNLIGFGMEPVERIKIAKDETKIINLNISPRTDFSYSSKFKLDYYLRAQDKSEVKKSLLINVIDFKEAFEIGSFEIDPKSNSIKVFIQNRVALDFKDLNVKFSSSFFNEERTFSLDKNQKKEFSFELDRDKFKELTSGEYPLSAEISSGKLNAIIDGKINFMEKDLLTTTEEKYGFIANTKIIKKVNEGNVLVKSETEIKKNIISRLFTSFNPEPDLVNREGLSISYFWNREVNPGESLEIQVKTNWFIPFLIIILIILIVILVKKYSKENISMKKRVSFVKAKGGEFALKVTINLRAKKYLERVSIIDRLPSLVKIYERFGNETPTNVDEANKRIKWEFEKLEEGEIRVLSYIIYSKVGVLGKFALPSATAIYERKGKLQESYSNRAFFVADQGKKFED